MTLGELHERVMEGLNSVAQSEKSRLLDYGANSSNPRRKVLVYVRSAPRAMRDWQHFWIPYATRRAGATEVTHREWRTFAADSRTICGTQWRSHGRELASTGKSAGYARKR